MNDRANNPVAPTLMDLLTTRAEQQADFRIYTFLEDAEGEETYLTHAELDAKARRIAASLAPQAVGERVMLLYPPGTEYIAGFFGCLYAGAVAVPAYPPDPMRLERTLPRLRSIIQDAQATVVLTNSFILSMAEFVFEQAPELRNLKWVATDELPAGLETQWKRPDVTGGSLAFLQYTSGSTGSPKGVMLSHSNLLENLRVITHCFDTHPQDQCIIWLPPYHDMGLIGGILQPLYSHYPVALMSPLSFLRKPFRWLQALTRFGGSVSGGPNFAYDLCVRKTTPEERSTLDLSRWRLAFNGAEPIRPETLERFVEAFAPYGFRREAFYPCYGLAEATLFVTGGLWTQPPVLRAMQVEALEKNQAVTADPGSPEARVLVGSGQIGPAHDLIVVDPVTRERRAPGQVGELWVSGPSVAGGYWGKPELSEETFRARPADGIGGPYLRTGDLGFLQADGELFVTGRQKDLIIIRGRNHYPQDLELTAERSHPAVRPGCNVAFSEEDENGERLVMVVEVAPRDGLDPEEVVAAVRSAVEREHELRVDTVVLARPGSVPKTSSGKLQRRGCRQMLREGSLEVVAQSSLRTAAPAPEEAAPEAAPDVATLRALPPAERRQALVVLVRQELARALRLPLSAVTPTSPVSNLGLDSLAAVELGNALEQHLGTPLPLSRLLGGPTPEELADTVAQALDAAPSHANTAVAATEPGDYPLTPGQWGLWFQHQLSPHTTEYNVTHAVRVRSELNVDALRGAFQALVDRHAALRTLFVRVDGQPVQRVLPRAEAHFHHEMASGWEPSRLSQRLEEEAARPFDLATGPLLRVHLFTREPGEHVLLLAFHHIIVDLASLAVLVQELGELYEALRTGRQPVLAPVKLDMPGYERQQREALAREGERLWEYWRQQLAGEPVPLELPSFRPRPPVQTYAGAAHNFRLPAPVAQRLQSLAREQGVTLYTLLLAAYQVLLHRYTGQDDIWVGSPANGRTRPQLASVVGYLVNQVVFRGDLSGEPSFSELLRRTQKTVLGALSHQELPFATLVDRLRVRRDPSRSALTQAELVLQRSHVPGQEALGALALDASGALLRVGSLQVESLALERRVASFDLTLTFAEVDGTLAGTLRYNVDVLDAGTVSRLAGHLLTMLEGIAADPSLPISRLPLLTEEERRELTRPPRVRQALAAGEVCLHRRFEAQVARVPGAEALTFEAQRLTYAQLEARANQLAHHLIRQGVRRGDLVGLYLERSPEMVIAVLAILKAGAAYVPIDTAYPSERARFMMEDSAARVLITQSGLASALGEVAPRVVLLDEQASAIAAEDTSRPNVPSAGEDLAYIIYTSGSTGRPKGVQVTHANVARLFDATDAWFHFDGSDVWTLFHSIAFDFSVWEVWGALLFGGRLVVVPHLVSRSPESFLQLLREERVTVLNQTPSAFRSLIQADLAAPTDAAPLSLRYVVFGGEALPLQSLRPWFERHGDERPLLVNMYGITETTVHVTYRPIRARDVAEAPGSVIGEPIPDLSVVLLDKHLQPVPVGVPGEIHVGGAGVARGYLNRPELTEQRFIADPSGEAGARLYRSGDLARRLPDGDVEYLGRIDDQVKIRGFRIELGEIESAVAKHPALREVVVIPREDGPGDKRLVAYAVPQEGHEAPAVGELRSFLRERLPEYMVPAAFVFLEAIPLTANGKVNRRALPAPEQLRPSLREGYVEPSNDLERLLAEVWRESLGLDRVGVDDNFFDLGGDSIRSLRVVAHARTKGLTISVAEMFEHQTVRALAAALRRGGNETVRTEPFSLLSEADRAALPPGLTDAYPLSMLQAGFIFHAELRQGYEVYLTSFHMRVRFDESALRRAADRLGRRHPMLRTSFDVSSFSEPLQLVHEEAKIPLTVLDWRGTPEAKQQRDFEAWTHAERQVGFTWRQPPLVRLHAHRLTDDTFRLTLSEPFLDGWSVASLWSELLRLYVASLQGETPVEPPPATTYRDFVALERTALTSEESRTFWARELTSVERAPVSYWPLRPGEAPGQHIRILFPVADDVFAGLKQIASETALPVKSVLIAAHTRVVALLTGRDEIVTGIIANGRPEVAGGDQVLGIFLNTIPLCLRLTGGTWMDLSRAAFEAERARLPHRRFPLAQLQKSFGDGQPLFDTAFNFTHFHVLDRLRELRGLEVLDMMATDQTYFAWTSYFNVNTASTELHIALDCNGLGSDQVEAIKACYLSVLSAMSRAPQSRYDTAELLPEREWQQLRAWNDTRAEPAGDTCVHHLVEAQVARTPEAIALVHEEQRLTYRELDARASRLAEALRGLGVGPEVRVAVCLERTPELIIALLGVMKAGGAYVPLDPAYPADRLAFMLEDSQAPVLVTARKLEPMLPPHKAQRVYLGAGEELPAGGSARGVTGPGNLAYVLYTSGSTGRPKGVSLEHRSAVAFLRWALGAFTREQLSGVLAATSFCFDLSVFEMFAPLSCGGRVILADNALALAGLKAAGEVTLVNTVPSAMTELVRSGAVPPSVTTVNLAGEPLPGSLARDLYRTGTVEHVFNLYGPTEDTTYSTYVRVPKEARGEPTIGRPLTGTSAWVLDARLRPVPIGVPGELYLGGAGLARGYLHRPELTAERFVPNPFSREPGARMYRTGDLVRLLPDGELEYLGRIDNQVKVRGFRIELGEVDAVLRQHPSVRDVVVHAREDSPGDKRLVAYVVAAYGHAMDAAVLKEHVQRHLPRYMVPVAFVAMEALPLTPNGKVNRKALPAPEASRVDTDSYVAPRNPTEELLAAVWARVLGVERVGAYDHFFELGGHSLLATRAVSRIREAFQVDLPLRSLFESPTIAALAELVDGIRLGREGLSVPPLMPLPRTETLPLSFAQQRLWFLDQLEPGSAAYNVPAAVRLKGALEVDALRRAFVDLSQRHESLRTTFHTVEGQAVQTIAHAQEPAFQLVDLSARPEAEREAEVRRLASEEALRPFDLTRGPLLRATLLRLGEREHVLLLTMHHIVSDGWSMNVLVEDVAALYQAQASGRPSSLPPMPVQYADYAVWQRRWLQGETLDKQLTWWRQQLEGAPHALELPTDRPRPAVQSLNGATWFVHLSRELSDSIQALGQREGVTPFMVLLAAFEVVLHRYSGQDDISVGTPIAGRGRPELERLIGFFANTLVLRTRFDAHTPFRELLTRVRETALGAYAHQDVPLEKLVEELQPQRDLSRSPLFQVMFTFQNTRLPDAARAGLELGLLEVDNRTSKFDLELVLTDSAEGFRGRFEYSTDLFDERTVAHLAEHLRSVLESAVSRPEQAVGDIPLLSEAEKRQLLVEWNDTHADVTLDTCFHQLFEAQVARTPEAIAVSDASGSLSYSALNAHSNRLAHVLLGSGVKPDSLVAILAPRSADFLAATLGVLKSGAAWLPLDPLHPAQRLAQVLSLSSAPLVLVSDELAPRLTEALALLPSERRPRVLSLESSLKASVPESNPPALATPSNLAYVIFTSGSTGTPKGAMLEHLGMLNHLHAKVRDLSLSAADTVAQTASQCFDISVWQFFSALMVGGRTLVLQDEVAHSPRALLEALDSHGVSIAETVPSLLAAMVEEADSLGASRPALSKLRWMMPTGEALPPAVARRWLASWPSVPLINAYGPTECSDDVTHAPLHSVPASAHVPIGRPVCNMRMYVLDAHARPVPVGVPGELYVGGTGVGRGYLDDPRRTAESFVPDPFSSAPGARLYRTGDKVRWLADGNLEFLGRIDFQVKVRGFRIELGEIESTLGQHPSVREVVVVAREDVPGDKRLVAYLSPRPGLTLDSDSLRAHLAQRLPEYMVPSAFMVLDSLPLTSNGKVDRKALPAPDASASDSRSYAPPRTRTEELLCGLFARLLRVERVGIHDDFFLLGGHSLLATRLVAQLREALGVELPLRALFEATTVARLAERLDALQASSRGTSSAPPLRPAPRDAALPLSFAQQRLWFLDQWQPGSAFYNIPAALRLQGPLDAPVLERGLQEVQRRHEVLRTTFQDGPQGPVQHIHPEAVVPLTLVDLQHLPSEDREREAHRLAAEEAQRPFDLARGPLLRTTLLRLGAEDHVLALTLHHSISDGGSMDVLLREVVALYGAFGQGESSPLPSLPVQYADYAAWQRSWLQGAALEEQLGWWRQQLEGAPHALELPTDRPRPALQTFHGALLTRVLPSALSESLRDFHRREGVTPFVTMLAATQALLHRYSGQEDFTVGSPVSGRTHAEMEGLIGFFVNTLVLRARVGPRSTFRELLARAKESTLGALAHQDVPFEKLVEVLQPQRDLSRPPLFQVMLAYQQEIQVERALPGLKTSPLPVDSQGAKFDLTLSLTDTREGLKASFEYNTDLYDEATVARMCEHLATLLEGAIARPDQPIASLPLMDEAERRRVLVEWNDSRVDFPRGLAHQLFEAQVARAPDAPAVSTGDTTLTYRELDARANQLARHLRSLGVGPESRVGLCVERSPDFVTGMLAILKAGGAWVPMDPTYPAERLDYMLRDSGVSVLLTQEGPRASLPATSARVVSLDTAWGEISREPATPPASGTSEDSLAYVIYTSGSTGRPKGTLLTHRGLCNTALAAVREHGFRPDSRVLQFASAGFDASVCEVFGALFAGACLHLAPRDSLMPGAPLHGLLRERSITAVTLTPSVLAQLEPEGLEGLETIITAGEACPPDTALRWAPGRRLLNAYGPTEVTVCATIDTQMDPQRPTIGKPFPNVKVYVLDERMEPVPPGVPGELYVGGPGVARGYIGRPELTAERFVPSPFSTEPGARLYRTGDRVRWLSSGTLEFLGRLDEQVKLRGFRIELGEVESVLREHPSVSEAVAMVREDVAGDRRLVAYVVAREGDVDASVLRTFLRERLPEHMVPAAFVPLAALPLSAHGKVERRALPAPGEAHVGSGQAYVEPQGELERTLASIWCEVLGLSRVGRHERFFDVGGNSMSIVRVQARVQQTLGLRVSLPELFQHPTLGALAEHLSSRDEGPKLEASQERGGSRRELMEKQRQARQAGRRKKGNES